MERFLIEWLRHSTLSALVTGNKWIWPVLETLHFLGLSLLIGTIGAFDLRLLGLGKGLRPGLLSRLLPWGIAGFALNVVTGILFFVGEPANYVHNIAFYFKMTFVVLADQRADLLPDPGKESGGVGAGRRRAAGGETRRRGFLAAVDRSDVGRAPADLLP